MALVHQYPANIPITTVRVPRPVAIIARSASQPGGSAMTRASALSASGLARISRPSVTSSGPGQGAPTHQGSSMAQPTRLGSTASR